MGNIFTAIYNVYNEPEEEPMILDTEEVSPGDVDISTVNLCQNLKNHIDTIVPLKSNSASATDIYVLNLKNLHFKNKPIHQGFIKMFIPSPERTELDYEMNVYKITNKLIDNKINPGFSYVYNDAINCTYQNIFDMLKSQTYINKGIEVKIPDAQLEQKFRRNMWYIEDDPKLKVNYDYKEALKKKFGKYRPALYADIPLGFTFRLNSPISDYKFSFILMESHADKKTLDEFMENELKSPSFEDEAVIREYKKLGIEQEKLEFLVREGFKWNNVFRVKMLQIFFLLCTALYAFSLSGCVHNDLHSGNIYIETLRRPEQSIFCINDKYYSITSQYKVYIYDFDRCYSKQLFNNKILDNVCDAFQCNEYYENLDIVKILCYMVRDYDLGTPRRSMADELIECIVPSHETGIRDMINESYTKGVFSYADDERNGCFFENITKDKKVNFFNRCYRMPAIIDNLYSKFFSSSRPVKVKNVNAFNLYVCHADYFTSEGMIKDERFVQEQYKKIMNSLLGIKTTARVRSRSEQKSDDTVEERRPKKARSADGRRKRHRSPARKDGRKGRKSPKKY
jgi:hypothetical protein